jgi:DNA transposition AAA+ family ATPase
MALSAEQRGYLATTQVPGTRESVAALRQYMALADLSNHEMAERVGYSRAAVAHFLGGIYAKLASTDKNLRVALWDYMLRNPIEPRAWVKGHLFETENVRRIRKYFVAATERGEVVLLYGPPGTQKTFALEHLVAKRNRDRKHDALYVYASQDIRPLALLKRIGREAGVRIGFNVRERILRNILASFHARPRPPAIIVDEAQHLPVDSLEILRELHDRSECGLILAGSHSLYENFLRGRQHLEQWLSRIDRKDPLPGLLEEEVREIAARELGNGHPSKISEKQFNVLLNWCRVDDTFARSPDGKSAPGKYLSVRRLVKIIAQFKARVRPAA